MEKRFDVLGIGCVAVDDIFYVDRYPPADSKVRANRTERRFGGLTGAALVAAARLGAHCAFAGLLGEDDLSKAVEADLKNEGIDLSGVVRKADAGPIRSVVIVSETSRTLFYDAGRPTGSDVSGPEESLIASSRVLFVDHLGVEGTRRAVEIAKMCDVAIVADFEEEVESLMNEIGHLIVGEEFAKRITGKPNLLDAAQALWNPQRDAVVITCGANGSMFMCKSNPNEVCHCPAVAVKAIDTTGCGDVFHGGYAHALAKGMPIQERIDLATRAAAFRAATGRSPIATEMETW